MTAKYSKQLAICTATLAIVLGFFCGSVALASGSKPSGFAVGMRSMGIWDPPSNTRLDVTVWYPALAPGKQTERDGWKVTAGSATKPAPGFFPIILLSHDTAMSRFSNSDLCVELAAQGYIVIVPTHTGDSIFDCSDLYTTMVLYDRPRHLLKALETVLASNDIAPHADESRIGLIGVGFGAITVSQLAGALPEPGLLSPYCNKNSGVDIFCSTWSGSMMTGLQQEVAVISKLEGPMAFTPPLGLFAPALEVVPIVAPQPEPIKVPPPKEEKAPSFMDSLRAKFGFEPAEEPELAPTPEDAEKNTPQESTEFIYSMDFQTGKDLGWALSGNRFSILELPDTPLFRSSLPKAPPPEAEIAPAKPVVDNRPYRRADQLRKIRSIALLSPAGGMMFSNATIKSTLPLLILEPEYDQIYPAASHGKPYSRIFSAKPRYYTLPQADHYSLFAPCSQELLSTLPETCGRLDESSRAEVATERDALLSDFFRETLGSPLPEPVPSGLKALPEVVEPPASEPAPPKAETPVRR